MTYNQYKTLKSVVDTTLIVMEAQYQIRLLFGGKCERPKRQLLYMELSLEIANENKNEINLILKELDLPELNRYNDFEDELNSML